MTLQIHLIGLPTDQNSSFERGAAAAPAAIRHALFSDRGNLSTECGLEIGTDIALIDLDEPWLVSRDSLLARSKNTPFEDARFSGRAVATYVAGRLVHQL